MSTVPMLVAAANDAQATVIPVEIASIVTGLPVSFFRRHALVKGTWRRGREFTLDEHGKLHIDIAAYERWVESGDSSDPPEPLPQPKPKKAGGPNQGPTRLYRHFDSAGQLLYVGISLRALYRLKQHVGGSAWAEQIARVEMIKFPTRKEALEAERAAIQAERPLFNIQHARKQ